MTNIEAPIKPLPQHLQKIEKTQIKLVEVQNCISSFRIKRDGSSNDLGSTSVHSEKLDSQLARAAIAIAAVQEKQGRDVALAKEKFEKLRIERENKRKARAMALEHKRQLAESEKERKNELARRMRELELAKLKLFQIELEKKRQEAELYRTEKQGLKKERKVKRELAKRSQSDCQLFKGILQKQREQKVEKAIQGENPSEDDTSLTDEDLSSSTVEYDKTSTIEIELSKPEDKSSTAEENPCIVEKETPAREVTDTMEQSGQLPRPKPKRVLQRRKPVARKTVARSVPSRTRSEGIMKLQRRTSKRNFFNEEGLSPQEQERSFEQQQQQQKMDMHMKFKEQRERRKQARRMKQQEILRQDRDSISQMMLEQQERRRRRQQELLQQLELGSSQEDLRWKQDEEAKPMENSQQECDVNTLHQEDVEEEESEGSFAEEEVEQQQQEQEHDHLQCEVVETEEHLPSEVETPQQDASDGNSKQPMKRRGVKKSMSKKILKFFSKSKRSENKQ